MEEGIAERLIRKMGGGENLPMVLGMVCAALKILCPNNDVVNKQVNAVAGAVHLATGESEEVFLSTINETLTKAPIVKGVLERIIGDNHTLMASKEYERKEITVGQADGLSINVPPPMPHTDAIVIERVILGVLKENGIEPEGGKSATTVN